MTPPAEGQEKDVLLVLDKQQGKVSAVKGIDKEGNLQTVPPTHGGEFMQVDKNSDVFSNFLSNFFRKFQDTSGLELFSVKASEAEQQARQSRTTTATLHRRATSGLKCFEFRSPTSTSSSRATASTRQKSTGRT